MIQAKLDYDLNLKSDISRTAPYQSHFEDWDVERHKIYVPLYSWHLSIADTIFERPFLRANGVRYRKVSLYTKVEWFTWREHFFQRINWITFKRYQRSLQIAERGNPSCAHGLNSMSNDNTESPRFSSRGLTVNFENWNLKSKYTMSSRP